MDFRRLAGTTALAAVSVCCASAEDIKLPGDWRGSIHGFGLVKYNVGLTDDVFTERSLRRPPAQWISGD